MSAPDPTAAHAAAGSAPVAVTHVSRREVTELTVALEEACRLAAEHPSDHIDKVLARGFQVLHTLNWRLSEGL